MPQVSPPRRKPLMACALIRRVLPENFGRRSRSSPFIRHRTVPLPVMNGGRRGFFPLWPPPFIYFNSSFPGWFPEESVCPVPLADNWSCFTAPDYPRLPDSPGVTGAFPLRRLSGGTSLEVRVDVKEGLPSEPDDSRHDFPLSPSLSSMGLGCSFIPPPKD